MPYLLNLIYLVVLLVLSPWLAYQALRTGKYRQGWPQKLLGLVPARHDDAFCVWLHAVSVGEVNLLEPLIRELAHRHPDWQFVISTTTQTGYALARKKHPDLAVFYCPLDFTWAVRRAMRRIRPQLFLLAELELWPNLLWAARRHGARVAVVNGRLSAHSFRGYRRVRGLMRRWLKLVDLVLAQTPEYAQRFTELGADPASVVVTGSIKFDGARLDRNNPLTVQLRSLAGFAADDIVWLAGSTQEPEEEIAVRVYQRLAPKHPRLRLVLVPRHPERFDSVARLLEQSGLPWRRRSELAGPQMKPGAGASSDKPMGADTAAADHRPILLVDTVGELGGWWGTAQLAFVGGSLGNRGGQNMIEPAAYGAAVCFGPNTRNFRDVVAALLAREAAVVVADENELETFLGRCLADPDDAAALGQRAREFVTSQQGATAATAQRLESLVPAEHGTAGKSNRSPHFGNHAPSHTPADCAKQD